ncbi:MAG: glucosamine--fructose-6-phosphate aminotransferase [Prolixibacteraceae bacterium]|nr:MAG: glucosamine--fructose-6-phosphate aminotransferase [Prolixibacteraceae bacterium]
MTKFLQDIYRQPEALQDSMGFTLSEGMHALGEAQKLIKGARYVFIASIGASWNAGLAIQAAFNEAGITTQLFDSAEFLHFTKIPKNTVVILPSRSGKSVEIVQSVTKCREAEAKIISITNDPQSPLGKGSDVCLDTHVDFDHSISVNTYTSIVLIGQLLAVFAGNLLTVKEAEKSITNALSATTPNISVWHEQIELSDWLNRDYASYFLGRGGNLASAYEAMLIWQEGAKHPASAMSTGAFRHGPQEILINKMNIGIWVDNRVARTNDFTLIGDILKQGVKVLTIGTDIPEDLGGLKIEIPEIHPVFQPLINVIPAQLATDIFSALKGENPDGFRFCKFVVETDGGL